jgi:hypothetical protein
MNVDLITMDPDEAREQLRDYRAQLHRRADLEYEAVVQGLEELAKGHRLLDVRDAIERGGFDERGRPRLAIARADRRQVEFQWQGWGSDVARFDARFRRHESSTLLLEFPVPQPAQARHRPGWETRGFSLVPMIPARVRNQVQFRERDVYVLWEVEAWSDTPLRAVPDRDPLLLRRLRGDAYAVLAEWDLTALERMVMTGRRGG